ncbi:hypothetical protein [Streptomyces anandii]|uniref:hypothetical protein n=1 Tax=Streptomyces anandii TaxID=285454 RepID=UPI001673DCE8|nr:hypothetical protein [Streptomyces anandii]GGX93280.1 hypothetical protein GCM10010510_43120 [Streptomyces anandii JCM 4720]
MHRARRTVPRALAGALAVLTAVLLALLGLADANARPYPGAHPYPAAGPTPAAGPPAHAATAAPPARTTTTAATRAGTAATPAVLAAPAPHAHDVCPDACVTRAGVRHERHGERPDPPGRHAVTVTAPALPDRLSTRASPGSVPVVVPLASPVPDRGRAPPTGSGTRHRSADTTVG